MSESSDSDAGFEFAMGEFTAWFPKDRLYGKNHMWILDRGGGRSRLGLTAYAVRLLQDVYFLDWTVDIRASLSSEKSIGSIESKKAESELYVPSNGTLATINDEVLDEPTLINAEPYDDGWLIEMDRMDQGPLMTPEQYAEHLVKAWKVAEVTIRGQVNR